MVKRSKNSRSSCKRDKATSAGHDCKFCKAKNIPYYTFYRKHRKGDCLKIHFAAAAAGGKENISSYTDETTSPCIEGSSVNEGNDAGSDACDYDRSDVSGDYGAATSNIVDSTWEQRHGPFYPGTESVAVSATDFDTSEALQEKVHERSDGTVGEVVIGLSQFQIGDGVSRDTANNSLLLLRRVAGAGACKSLPCSVSNIHSMMNVQSLDKFSVRYCMKCCHVISTALSARREHARGMSDVPAIWQFRTRFLQLRILPRCRKCDSDVVLEREFLSKTWRVQDYWQSEHVVGVQGLEKDQRHSQAVTAYRRRRKLYHARWPVPSQL